MSLAISITTNEIYDKTKTKNDIQSPKKLIDFPQRNDTTYKTQIPINSQPPASILSNPNLYHLLVKEFNPHNVASSPPNAFISVLKQRMDCYFECA